MATIRETGRGLIVHNGKVILMERWRDGLHYFSIPGGGVEPGESPEEATVRELHEELGINASIVRKLYEITIAGTKHHIYLCKYLNGEASLQPNSPEAIAHAGSGNLYKPIWVDIVEVKDLPFIYWEPLKPQLVQDLQEGFGVDTKTITV